MSYFPELDALMAEMPPEPRRRPDAQKTGSKGPHGPRNPAVRAARLEAVAMAMRQTWGQYKAQRHRMAALIRWGKLSRASRALAERTK